MANKLRLKQNLPIKFYLYNTYLGIGFITEGSDSKQRKDAARKVGIQYYNGIVIGNRDLRNYRIKLKSGKLIRDIDFADISSVNRTESLYSGQEFLTCKQRKAAHNIAFKEHLKRYGTRLIKN